MAANKVWGFHEPVNSNDLNLNFLYMDLRLQAIEQAIGQLRTGVGTVSAQLAFLDSTAATFFDGTPISFAQ